jgi:hypothetical protein
VLAVPEGQRVVDGSDLDRLHDRLYALEAAMEDVTADLAQSSAGTAYRQAFQHLWAAAAELRGTVVEPVTS